MILWSDEIQCEIEESLYSYGIKKTIENAFAQVMHGDIIDKRKAVSYLAEIAAKLAEE